MGLGSACTVACGEHENNFFEGLFSIFCIQHGERCILVSAASTSKQNNGLFSADVGRQDVTITSTIFLGPCLRHSYILYNPAL